MPKQVVTPPPTRFTLPLIITIIAFIIIAILLVIFGKLIVAGIISLLGAVFSLSSQIDSSERF